MREEHFCTIQVKLDEFKFYSMKYLEYDEISNYEVQIENDNIILIYGFNREAKMYEYHWATNEIDYLISNLCEKKDFLITFIPQEWVLNLEQLGFITRNAWHDYFIKNINNIITSDRVDFLTIDRCKEASQVTMMCKNQSRGFTGQTTEWMREWINKNEASQTNNGIKNNAVLIEQTKNEEIVGILCVATYAHESEEGPCVWIREVAVKPSFQNRGIGRKLIMQALSYGKSYNAKRAFLTVDECNVTGIHLYTSIGFLPGDDKSQIDMIKEL